LFSKSQMTSKSLATSDGGSSMGGRSALDEDQANNEEDDLLHDEHKKEEWQQNKTLLKLDEIFGEMTNEIQTKGNERLNDVKKSWSALLAMAAENEYWQTKSSYFSDFNARRIDIIN